MKMLGLFCLLLVVFKAQNVGTFFYYIFASAFFGLFLYILFFVNTKQNKPKRTTDNKYSDVSNSIHKISIICNNFVIVFALYIE